MGKPRLGDPDLTALRERAAYEGGGLFQSPLKVRSPQSGELFFFFKISSFGASRILIFAWQGARRGPNSLNECICTWWWPNAGPRRMRRRARWLVGNWQRTGGPAQTPARLSWQQGRGKNPQNLPFICS
jgi:hypothetical protein